MVRTRRSPVESVAPLTPRRKWRAILIATLTAGLYPAWRAGNVVPVESIRLV